ncbi:hypothetical protein AVEN_237410-1, partial [Araneus ventricosus]
ALIPPGYVSSQNQKARTPDKGEMWHHLLVKTTSSLWSDLAAIQESELDILNSGNNKNNTAMNCDEDEDDEDGNDHDTEINKPSYDEMLKSFETIRRTV